MVEFSHAHGFFNQLTVLCGLPYFENGFILMLSKRYFSEYGELSKAPIFVCIHSERKIMYA
jgi:hypothetical protein